MSLKYVVLIIVLGVCGLLGKIGYTFFFDSTKPFIMIYGIENNKSYAGDIECKVSSDKSGNLAVWLDEKPLITSFKLAANVNAYPFTIPTKTLANGKHMLKATLTDKTFNKNVTAIERNFEVDNVPLQAAFIKQDMQHKVFQGRTLHVQFQVNKPIKKAEIQVLAHTYDCIPESKNSSVYECFIPIACEEMPNEYLLSAVITDRVGNVLNLDSKFHIMPFPFKTQHLHVDSKQVEKEKEVGLPNSQLEEQIAELTKKSPKEKLWRGAFCTPLEVKRVTCDFGTVRTTQEKGRYAHKALDVINLPKSVVWSTQNGIVVIKDRYAMTGNTVVVDHGMGILSMFCHLEDFADIEVGQKVAKGNPVGTMGKTGYAQGYHLHWEMRLNNIAIDPMQWTKANF
ncbi:M23 family metallopeptidase [Candidatus Dependentiae bacterium]|nr:M23 family metallopeptidase [Candidatus Dependentiae bacterium]